MDPEVLVAIVSTLGAVITGLLGWRGVKYTRRLAARGQARSQQLESERIDQTAYKNATAMWESGLSELRNDLGEMRKNRQMDREDLKTLRDEVKDLRRGREADHAELRRLTDYTRELLRLLNDAGISFPPPPDGLLNPYWPIRRDPSS